jgi:transposase
MEHVDMRKLPAAAQEERRRQVIGLREVGLTYGAIAAQVGLTQAGVFGICQRFAAHGKVGLKSGPRGPEAGSGRRLDQRQEAEVRALIKQHLKQAAISHMRRLAKSPARIRSYFRQKPVRYAA